MAKVFRIWLVFCCISLLLTGCWNRREINDLVIAVGMGVDKAEEGFLVSVQVVDPNEIAAKKASGRAPVTIYKEKGSTIFEAVRKMTSTSARKIYFSHLRMFLIGEELAKEDIAHVVEFLSRDHEIRSDFYLAIAKNSKAAVILKGLSAIERIPANKMFTSLEMSSRAYAATGTLKIDELISDLMTEGKSPVMTTIIYIGDTSKAEEKKNVEVTDVFARLKFDGIAVFRKNKLAGWLNEKESKGYNYVTGKVKSTVEAVPCTQKNGKVTVELHQTSRRIEGKLQTNHSEVRVDIEAEGRIGEILCKLDLTDPAVIHELEHNTEKLIKEYVEKTLNKVVTLKSDFVGLGAAIHQSNPKAWKTMKKNWTEQLESLQLTVNVKVKIRNTGKTNKSFLEKMKD